MIPSCSNHRHDEHAVCREIAVYKTTLVPGSALGKQAVTTKRLMWHLPIRLGGSRCKKH